MSTVSSNVLIQQLTAKWRTNDMYAQILIVSNISKGQMVHVARLDTAAVIWASLRAIHETKDYIAIQRGLFELRANEGSDIVLNLNNNGNVLTSWIVLVSISQTSNSRRLSLRHFRQLGMFLRNPIWAAVLMSLKLTLKNS